MHCDFTTDTATFALFCYSTFTPGGYADFDSFTFAKE